MTRNVEQPTLNERGDEVHPAFGLIGASRVSSTPPSALFDSDIRHHHYVVVTIATASRKRDLNRDWIHQREEFVEVAMSEAQWASFVSSMNTGSGVSCTIKRREDQYDVPDVPYQPRLAESMREVRAATEEATEKVAAAFAAYAENKTKRNLDTLKYAIENMPANLDYAAKSLSEHAENVVQKARADIEAMVVAKAAQLGLDAADVAPLELTTGDQDNDERTHHA